MSLGHVQCPYVTPHDDDGHLNCRYREGHELPHSTCYGNDGPGLKWYISEPACGDQCSACNPSPASPATEREWSIYWKAFEDGKQSALRASEAELGRERAALAEHWSR